MMKTCLGFGDLALIFKVTAGLNKSNLSICGGGRQGEGTYAFFEINSSF